ncbi:MAG: hypothetical protein ACI85Q_002220 [Salibacteraceae bacterium]|jgi:hypothetical protein
MKNTILGTCVVLGMTFLSCGNSNNSESTLSPGLVKNPATASAVGNDMKLAKMEFEVSEQDFGSIVQGESIKKVFEFTNVSEVDLIISSANGSCGCTIPKWPKRPIKPGQTGEIEVVFNSQGKKGKQTKKVYVTANTSPVNNVIVIKGDVVAPE